MKWFFWKKKIFPHEKKKLPFFYATFQCGRYNVKKKKKIFFNFLPMKNWKKHPKTLLRIGPDPFFPRSSPGISPQPKIDFPYYEISGPDICSLICGKIYAFGRILKPKLIVKFFLKLLSVYCIFSFNLIFANPFSMIT